MGGGDFGDVCWDLGILGCGDGSGAPGKSQKSQRESAESGSGRGIDLGWEKGAGRRDGVEKKDPGAGRGSQNRDGIPKRGWGWKRGIPVQMGWDPGPGMGSQHKDPGTRTRSHILPSPQTPAEPREIPQSRNSVGCSFSQGSGLEPGRMSGLGSPSLPNSHCSHSLAPNPGRAPLGSPQTPQIPGIAGEGSREQNSRSLIPLSLSRVPQRDQELPPTRIPKSPNP